MLEVSIALHSLGLMSVLENVVGDEDVRPALLRGRPTATMTLIDQDFS